MIKAVYACDLFRRPVLAASMFQDRTAQFRDRLGWNVQVDDMGLEFDQYDAHNPIYLIVEAEDGSHIASTRIMSTTGPTMVADHFSHLTGGVAFQSPLIWESTRFCISPKIRERTDAARRIPAALLWAGATTALKAGVEFFIAVFSEPMFRFYKSNGWLPEVLGSGNSPEGPIYAGLWEVTPEICTHLARRAGPYAQQNVTYFPDQTKFPFSTETHTAPASRTSTHLEELAIAC